MAVAKNVKPTTKNSPPVKTGANRDNGPAEMYAKNGVGVSEMEKVTTRDFTNKKSAYDVKSSDPAMTVSVGYNDVVNPYGVGVMRGAGAATKGKKISGKMG